MPRASFSLIKASVLFAYTLKEMPIMKIEPARWDKDTRQQAYDRERAYVEKAVNGDPDALKDFDFFVFLGWDRDRLKDRTNRWDYEYLYGCTAGVIGC